MRQRLLLIMICVGLAAGDQLGQRAVTAQEQVRPKTDVTASESRKALRLKATSTLDSVVTELSQVDSLVDRLSIAEGVVKLLAKSNPESCRKILDSLFDGVQDLRAPHATDSKTQSPNPDRILERIVRLAALVDPKLAESYIKRYSTTSESEASDQKSGRNTQNATLRLKMALDLLDKAPTTSLAIAESSLPAGVFPDTLAFLGSLRKRDLSLANNFFREALLSVGLRGGSDVNELLLLYAYVFSPLRVPVVSAQGLGVYNIPSYNGIAQAYPVDPTLARLYFDTTSQMVLDPNRLNPESLPRLARGIIGEYYFIAILQPAAANYAPQLSEQLSLRKTVLNGLLQPQQRESSTESADRWNNIPSKVSLTGDGNKTTVDYLLERADKATDPAQKDRFYYQAATTAVHSQQYERAIKIVDKIAGAYSVDAKRLILFDIALDAARHKDIEKAEFYGRQDDNPSRRSFVFTVIAANLVDGANHDPKRAREFLEEVAGLASRLDKQSDKTAVLFGIVAVYSGFDPAAALQSSTLAIDAANKLESFGRDLRIQSGLDIGGFLFDYSMYGEEYTFIDGIKNLANKDFDETLSHIRMIKARVPRLRATVVLCDAVLSKAS